MQPVQLSLIPDPHPRPAATLAEQLPEKAIAAALVVTRRDGRCRVRGAAGLSTLTSASSTALFVVESA
ncbi:MAG: hypothetical protein M3460_23400 [Actinomycetota bacterium]|nr:hypothetical protein [Actinomycetota bacterium]